MIKHILHSVFIFLFFIKTNSQNKEVTIISSWQFKQVNKSKWLKAIVPGNVHKDLLLNKSINNPYYSNNDSNLQWIENEEWEYKTFFDCNASFLNKNHIELIFEGLDTYAKVYLNDSLILSANNMFRSWQIDVKKLLKLKKNKLYVRFESAVKKGKEESKKLTYTLPEDEKNFTRKSQYQYGWDFSPRLVSCGIWKNIKLSCWDNFKIESIQHQILELNDSIAKINFFVESNCEKNGIYAFILNEINLEKKTQKFYKSKFISKGNKIDTFTYLIKKPKLWWCNGIGKQNIYHFQYLVSYQNSIQQKYNLNVGLRNIDLVQENDSIGKTFYFKLNGKPLFIKGCNYVPNDIFLNNKNNRHVNLVKLCKNAHMNMIRIWGGGIYADDKLIENCDKSGILVWQDLMFACAMYPGDSAFIENVKKEVTEQFKRLNNHPSIALWCGNNEIDEGWHNWGWQKKFNYSKSDSTKIWNDYLNLFHKIIPNIITKNDSKSNYWPSSPKIGWGKKESLYQGDSHYWGIWWGMEPFKDYENKVGRFVSEYGFQSLPSLSSFKTFCSKNELNLNSVSVNSHQKNKKGFETIQTYMKHDYDVPQKFENFIYVSQLLQRDGMKIAIESHRSNKPNCMGTLFWQLNDCWPAISWSAIDFNENPKAFYYTLKNIFNTNLILVKSKLNELNIITISDSLISFNALLKLKLITFKGKKLWEKDTVQFISNSTSNIFLLKNNNLPNFDSTSCYLKTELILNNKIISKNYHFFKQPKYLKLPKVNILITKINETNFEISSRFFAKDVYLYNQSKDLIFSENYFNLEPGEKKIIKINNYSKNFILPILKTTVLNNL